VRTALWWGGGEVGGFSSLLGVVGKVGPCMGGVCGRSTLGNNMSSMSSSLLSGRAGDVTRSCGTAGRLGTAYTG
jgi:hypothetical protein